jgi:putative transposase
VVEPNDTEAIALHRWGVIAEAANPSLGPAQRGAVVRAIAARTHAHPDGTERVYSRNTIDRWLRAWRTGGLDALRPKPRADTGVVRARPELFEEAAALRLELPSRSAAQIVAILHARHGVSVAPRTLRDQLRRRGLHRDALAAEPKVFGRYEAEAPNDRWLTDVLIGPWVPHPRIDASVRARLFLVVDDHSRLLVHGRFHRLENARAGQETLRAAIVRRGLPAVLYADNGSPFKNAALSRTCAVLGIRLVHSQPYSPEGRGKQERLNRLIKERFIAEAEHVGVEDLASLNDRFEAWSESVANRRIHAETNQAPIARWEAGGPPRGVDPARLRDAFRWSVIRRVSRTATVSLESNAYSVDPALVAQRVELRFDPEDLTTIEVFHQGRAAGVATPFVIGRHTHRATPPPPRAEPSPTGVDYLGLVEAAHEAETTGSISFAQMPLFDLGEEEAR